METQTLHTASHYLNNLLLSRGLLKNGAPIAFAKPSKAEGGTEATMAKVINLVHDMILRRDRETEQRENLAMTIHALRANESKQNLELERHRTALADSDRSLSLATARVHSLSVTLATHERTARSLREDLLRQKTILTQVRTQCANDLRKRDVQIQRLKAHLTGQQRGMKAGAGLSNTVITITPGHGADMDRGRDSTGEGGPDLANESYSLTQETTEFLTRLSQELSDENDNLIGLVKGTLGVLREIQGLETNHDKDENVAEHNLGETAEERVGSSQGELAQTLPTSYETLAGEIDEVLEHLKGLLTNPNFVPLEEVEIREEEIVRLRDGWEKMEGRWREAVKMMDGWRKRMVSGGKGVNLDELRMGLSLSPVKVGVALEDVEEMIEEDSGMGQISVEDRDERHDELDEAQSTEEEDEQEKVLNFGLQPVGNVLGEITGNPKLAGLSSDESSDLFKEIAQDDATHDQREGISSAKKTDRRVEAKSTSSSARSMAAIQDSRIPRQLQKRSHPSESSSVESGRPSKLSKATIERKLNRAKAEADRVTQRDEEAHERSEKMGAKPKPPISKKREKVIKPIRSRRRSTLTTEELESLMMGNSDSAVG